MLFGLLAKRFTAALKDEGVSVKKGFGKQGRVLLLTVLTAIATIPLFANQEECSSSFEDSRDKDRKLVKPIFNRPSSSALRIAAQRDEINSETHDFYSIVESDPEKNLFVQHPFSVMNAFQRAHAIHQKYKPEMRAAPDLRGSMVQVYPLFHRPLDANGGLFLIGHHDVVRSFYEMVAEAANTRARSSKTFLVVGAPGTGKTLFLDILNKSLEYHTSLDPDCYTYTFEWQHMEVVPELVEIIGALIRKAEVDGKKNWTLSSAIYESPIVLVPAELQESLMELYTPAVVAKAGVKPNPFLTPTNPQTVFVRDLLMSHYQKVFNRKLTVEDQLKILQKHVVIKRKILGEIGGAGKIGFQGTDIDWSGLIAQTNPFVAATMGSSHPFAYHYNGKVLQNQGGVVGYDEWYRNKDQFIDWNLDVQESRIVQRGGMAAIQLDALIIAASNTESVDKKSAEAPVGANKDRTMHQVMDAVIAPVEVAETMWVIKGLSPLRQAKLADTLTEESVFGEWQNANLAQLYPERVKRTDPILTPYGRYALSYDVGPTQEPVWIAPHTIELMSYVVAATRMVTDPNEAVKFGGHYQHTVNRSEFLDPVQRLKAYLKRALISDAVGQELYNLSKELREGSRGISTRDAGKIWLKEVIAMAQRPGNGNTATPALAREAFLNLLKDGTLIPPSTSDRAMWLALLDAVSKEIIAPDIEKDFHQAISEGSENIHDFYDEVVFEILAISNDPEAKTYEGRNGSIHHIKLDRLSQILSLYQEINQRSLAIREIISLVAFDNVEDVMTKRRHPALVDTLRRYQARIELERLSFNDLSKYMDGETVSHTSREKYDSIARYLVLKLGYNKRSIHEAVSLIMDMRSSTVQANRK